MYIVEFSHVVLAKLPLLYVLLDGVLADNAGAFPVVWVVDYLCTFRAELSKLGDAVSDFPVLVAGQLDEIGEAFLEIMSTQRRILVLDDSFHMPTL